MAENTNFVLGVLGSDFMQMKTTDNIYLKDIIANIQDSLGLYNSRETELAKLLAYKYTDSNSQEKLIYGSDEFTEIGEIQTPGMRAGFEVWNLPNPMRRFGALTKITREKLKTMSSSDINSFHNGKMVADKKNLVKLLFKSMMVKAPSPFVDCIDGIATTAKAFWNADTVDTPRSNGQMTFANTHEHYNHVATGDTLLEADVDTFLIEHITEHEGIGAAQIILWARTGTTLNQIKALASYKAIVNDSVLIGTTPTYANSGAVQAVIRTGKALGWNVKVVGSYKEALVVETPDIPIYYILATAYAGDNDAAAPVGWREHPSFPGLILLSPTDSNPIIGADAQYRRYYAFSVRNRSAGACLYTHGHSSYVEPTFA